MRRKLEKSEQACSELRQMAEKLESKVEPKKSLCHSPAWLSWKLSHIGINMSTNCIVAGGAVTSKGLGRRQLLNCWQSHHSQGSLNRTHRGCSARWQHPESSPDPVGMGHTQGVPGKASGSLQQGQMSPRAATSTAQRKGLRSGSVNVFSFADERV